MMLPVSRIDSNPYQPEILASEWRQCGDTYYNVHGCAINLNLECVGYAVGIFRIEW